MLFAEDPEHIATGANVKIGRFRTDSDLLYQDEIHGDLIGQVDRTLDLLVTKYLKAGISYDRASHIPIQISGYDDKVMIWNAGILPPDWTPQDFTAKHASVPFNPAVASVFSRAALLESWGRGIELIRDACLAHGSPLPVFRWSNGLWVELPFKARPETRPESRPESRSE